MPPFCFKSLLAFCALVLWPFFAIGQIEPDLKYEVVGRVSVVIRVQFPEKKFVVELQNVKLKGPEPTEKILRYHKGFVYHSRSKAVYAEGFSREEFELQVKQNRFNKTDVVLRYFLPRACASDENCKVTENQIESIAKANHGLKLADLTKIIGNCDFSIAKLIEQKVNSTLDLIGDLFTGELFKQISDAVNAIWDLLPAIYDKLVIPLGEIFSVAPAIAQTLICEFTSDKIGDLAVAAMTGGSSLSSALAKTGVDLAALVQKASVLTRSKKVLALVQDIHKRGLLNQETVDRLLKLKHDVPDEHKVLNVRFRAEDNLIKHFEKHKAEMGFKSPEEYQAAAQRLVKRSGDSNVVVYPLPNGDFNKMDLLTNEMVVTNKYGNIITYFKFACKNDHEKLLFLLYSKEAPGMGICRDRAN